MFNGGYENKYFVLVSKLKLNYLNPTVLSRILKCLKSLFTHSIIYYTMYNQLVKFVSTLSTYNISYLL